jgi:methyltransferase family protein
MPRSALPIHGLVRYEPVLALIRALGGGSVLEVGSANLGAYGYGLTEPNWSVTVLDQSFDNYGHAAESPPPSGCRKVIGDAREMPFADREFDVVLALDLIEHVLAKDRQTVLAELGRVAARRIIVGCPAGQAALEADRKLPGVYAFAGHPVPSWLEEHFENGFPEPAELRTGLEPFGDVTLLGNESARAHVLMMRVHVVAHWLRPFKAMMRLLGAPLRPGARGRPLVSTVLKVVRGFDRAPTYRTIAVVDVSPPAEP